VVVPPRQSQKAQQGGRGDEQVSGTLRISGDLSPSQSLQARRVPRSLGRDGGVTMAFGRAPVDSEDDDDDDDDDEEEEENESEEEEDEDNDDEEGDEEDEDKGAEDGAEGPSRMPTRGKGKGKPKDWYRKSLYRGELEMEGGIQIAAHQGYSVKPPRIRNVWKS
jgi:hypothetical protein